MWCFLLLEINLVFARYLQCVRDVSEWWSSHRHRCYYCDTSRSRNRENQTKFMSNNGQGWQRVWKIYSSTKNQIVYLGLWIIWWLIEGFSVFRKKENVNSQSHQDCASGDPCFESVETGECDQCLASQVQWSQAAALSWRVLCLSPKLCHLSPGLRWPPVTSCDHEQPQTDPAHLQRPHQARGVPRILRD